MFEKVLGGLIVAGVLYGLGYLGGKVGYRTMLRKVKRKIKEWRS